MATKYEKKIQQLMGHVKQLHQLIEERTQQLHYWQGYAKQVRQERQRLGEGMLAQFRQALAEVAERYRYLQESNQKLLDYTEHRAMLADRTQLTLRNQLQYALSRIDELSLERKQARQEAADRYHALLETNRQLTEEKDLLAANQQEIQARLAAQQSDQHALRDQLDALQRQIEIQQEQWQQVVAQRDGLATKLEETENALAIAQRTVAEGMGAQQSNIGRDVSDLRSLVVSLQKQTEHLREEVSAYQDELAKKDRFIALLKEDRSASIRTIGKGKPTEPPPAKENA